MFNDPEMIHSKTDPTFFIDNNWVTFVNNYGIANSVCCIFKDLFAVAKKDLDSLTCDNIASFYVTFRHLVKANLIMFIHKAYILCQSYISTDNLKSMVDKWMSILFGKNESVDVTNDNL